MFKMQVVSFDTIGQHQKYWKIFWDNPHVEMLKTDVPNINFIELNNFLKGVKPEKCKLVDTHKTY